VRSFAYGFLSVVLGLYLDTIGLSATAIGWICTAALAGGAAMTILITLVADRYGRKTLLILGTVLMAIAGGVFAITANPILLALAAIFGTNVLAPLSFLAVPAIARRFGLFRSRVMVISIEP
jgi:MFS family permease